MLKSLKTHIDTLYHEIERDRISVDVTSQDAVDEFNASVDRRNALIRQWDTAATALLEKARNFKEEDDNA